MVLRIQHNIPALNNLNNSRKTTADVQKTYEKLSSGYKINRAGDDAAGLAISEKMRGQIRGLEQAERNIQDGISLVQVADAGLGEISNPNLIRMRELAVLAATDTLTDADRVLIQGEINQIKEGINGLANNTEFNTIKLLNVPDFATIEKVTHTDSTKKEISVTVKPQQQVVAGYIEIKEGDIDPIELFAAFGSITGASWPDMNIISPNGEEFGYADMFLNSNSPITDTTNSSSSEAFYNGYNASNEEFNFKDPIKGKWLIKIHHDGGEKETTFKVKSNYHIIGLPTELEETTETITIEKKPNLVLQVGPNEGHHFLVDLTDARTAALGVDKVDLSIREGAEKAIELIDGAIQKVSEERSKYGAYMNALEHIQNNVGNAMINLTKAESSIRDTDMAKEITKLQKDQVLLQASQAMMAQINQMGQGILQLLK